MSDQGVKLFHGPEGLDVAIEEGSVVFRSPRAALTPERSLELAFTLLRCTRRPACAPSSAT